MKQTMENLKQKIESELKQEKGFQGEAASPIFLGEESSIEYYMLNYRAG